MSRGGPSTVRNGARTQTEQINGAASPGAGRETKYTVRSETSMKNTKNARERRGFAWPLRNYPYRRCGRGGALECCRAQRGFLPIREGNVRGREWIPSSVRYLPCHTASRARARTTQTRTRTPAGGTGEGDAGAAGAESRDGDRRCRRHYLRPNRIQRNARLARGHLESHA